MKRIIKVLICCVLAVSMLAPMTATAATRLATPKGFKVVTTTTSSVKVKWNKVKGVKYTVQYSAYKNFKKSKKVNVKSNVATIKKLKSKKFYYFRVRAYKKGRKASKYTKTTKVKTVNRLNVDKKLKGTWQSVGSIVGSGGEITELTFNGKGKVTVHVYGGGYEVNYKKTVKYTKSGTSAKFTAFGTTYTVKCYTGTNLIGVTEKSKNGSYQYVYIKTVKSVGYSLDKFEQNFVDTNWNSSYFKNACKNKNQQFYGVQIGIDNYGYDGLDDEFYALVNSSKYNENGYLLPIRNNIAWARVNVGNTYYVVIIEKVSSKKANAFIYPNDSITYKKEVWTLK